MNTVTEKIAVGYAHSKLILTGEHAVVYGKPAIAIPFPLKVKALVEKSSGAIMFNSSIYTGPVSTMPNKMKGISACIAETLQYLNKPFQDINIKIQSAIPLGRGLGSSAAVATAIVRGLFSLFGKEPTREEVYLFVQIAETYAHGKPSGIDMAAVSSEAPIWFQKGKKTETFNISQPLYITVADTGEIGNTRTAVENVKERYNNEQLKVQRSLDSIEEISKEAKAALLNGNTALLGKLINNNQQELNSLGVSDKRLNLLVNTARNAGALGAKLTGGGLGGCMLALAKNLEEAEDISKQLVRSGAFKSWYFSTCGDIFHVSREYGRKRK